VKRRSDPVIEATTFRRLAQRSQQWTVGALWAMSSIVGGIAPATVMAGVNSWSSNGPYGGQVTVLAVDPKTPATMYAAGFSGVFKSTDGGANWSWASKGMTDTSVDALVIDPVTPTTLYAGSIHGGAIVKSVDGGANWTPLSVTLVVALAIDPKTTSTLYASQQQNGLSKSIDSGATWNPIGVATLPSFPTLRALVVDPVTTSTLYAGDQSNGVYKSIDGGATWNPVNTGFTGPIIQVIALAIDPQTPATLYAAANTSGGSGLFQSTDSGAHWNRIYNDGSGLISIQTIAIDPSTTSTLYIGSFSGGVLRSTNSGTSFSPAKTGLPAVGVDALAINPSTASTVYAGTLNGVFATGNSGAAWSASSNGLALTTVTTLAIDPATPATIYAGTTLSGIFKSVDGGGSWTSIYTGIGTTGNGSCAMPSIATLAIDPSTPATLYAGTLCTQQKAVLKSIDGGATWNPAVTGLPLYGEIASLAIDPQNTSTIYAAAAGTGLYLSTNAGANWTLVDAVPTTDQFTSVSISASTGNPSRIALSTNGDGVYLSTDGGASFDQLAFTTMAISSARGPSSASSATPCVEWFALHFIGLDKTLLGDALYAQCFSPPQGEYVATSSASPMSRMADATGTIPATETIWAPPDGSSTEAAACAPLSSVVNPVDVTGASFYAGADCGVLFGTDYGATVVTMNNGLPTSLQMNAMAVTPSGNSVYAGAQSGGVWQLTPDSIFGNGFEMPAAPPAAASAR